MPPVQQALKAIADPNRLEILRIVRDREMSAGAISTHFDVTRPAVSQHLQVLVSAGLVSVHKDGTRRLYQSRPEGLDELRAFLDDFWGHRLSVLKTQAEADQRRKDADDD